jgi:hypothetical protein
VQQSAGKQERLDQRQQHDGVMQYAGVIFYARPDRQDVRPRR